MAALFTYFALFGFVISSTAYVFHRKRSWVLAGGVSAASLVGGVVLLVIGRFLLGLFFGHEDADDQTVLPQWLGLSVSGILFAASLCWIVWLTRRTEKKPNQPPQHNAGGRPSSGDSSASETTTSLGPRG